MNSERFTHITQFPESITAEDTKELKAVCEAFPFSSLSNTLYIKGLKLHDEFQFHRNVKIRIAHIQNREALYELCYPESELIQPLVVKEEVPVKELHPEKEEKKKKDKKKKKKEKQVQQKEEQGTLVEQVKTVLPEVEPKKEMDELDRLIYSQAVNASLQAELKPENTEVEKETISEEPKVEKPPVQAKTLSEFLALQRGEDIGNEKKPIKEKNIHSIIDGFITRDSERITPPRNEFFKPVDMARQSMVDNESMVTETLANLMVKTGNIAKAIRYFEILSLNNPEKSNYFAAQIKKLK